MGAEPDHAHPAMNEARTQWLNQLERGPSPNVRPRDAATLILLDRAGMEPKVLLGRRHGRHAFMPDKFVFPGGGVDPSDYAVPVARPLPEAMERRLMARMARPSPGRARALAVAAIRELAEETGLFLGRPSADRLSERGPWRAHPEARVLPDPAGLYFVARAITPPGRARRFDTRFFVAGAEAIAHRVEGLVTAESELVEIVWMPLAQAKELDMPLITRVVLNDLQERIAAGLDHDRPVPFYRALNRRRVHEHL